MNRSKFVDMTECVDPTLVLPTESRTSHGSCGEQSYTTNASDSASTETVAADAPKRRIVCRGPLASFHCTRPCAVERAIAEGRLQDVSVSLQWSGLDGFSPRTTQSVKF